MVATGGLSIPKIGATGFAYDLARQFGHELITPEPALVPLTFEGEAKAEFASMAGVSTQVIASGVGGSQACDADNLKEFTLAKVTLTIR